VCLVPHFIKIFFGFWFIILQNGTKHHAKFLAKRYQFSILDFGLKRPKKSQKALTHLMKILTFWMELNTPMKILAFCISSFQSSWHFVFCIPRRTKHSLRTGRHDELLINNNEIASMVVDDLMGTPVIGESILFLFQVNICHCAKHSAGLSR
jgi:hypothetical protein